VAWTDVDRLALLDALRQVRYAVGRDGARPGYMIVDIRNDHMTSCDGVRFQRVALPGVPDMQIPAAGTPAAADQLVKLLTGSEMAQVQTAVTERSLLFRAGTATLIVQKFQARFADVENMMLRPALENKLELQVGRQELLDAVRRVRMAADPNTSAIALSLSKGRVLVQARDSWENAASESVSAVWEHPDRTIVLNHRFLVEALTGFPKAQCTLRLGPETARKKSMIMLKDEDSGWTAVLTQMLRSMLGF
jgi:DNA polymerase III sliding clamp (beta) subunit (PCNA family)